MRTLTAIAIATALVASAPKAGEAALTRLTNPGGQDCVVAAPTVDATASLVAFESTCDFTGQNPDLNREIFRVDREGTVTQLTDTTGCANANPSSDASGGAVAFDSDCDLAGSNADRNVEVFLIDGMSILQLTETSDCTSLAPAVDAAGGSVAFDSDCDFDGANADRSVEVFRVLKNGAVEQVSDDRTLTGCASYNATSDASGEVIAFESDCDLLGLNPFQLNEIFQATAQGVAQLTSSDDEPCFKTTPAVSADGGVVAFASDCDLVGANDDASVEVFSLAAGEISQLSDDPGTTGCESFDPRAAVDADGDERVVFSSYCNLAALNGDRSFEVFRATEGAVTQLTAGGDACWSVSPTISADGQATVFASNCGFGGLNPGGRAALFLAPVCACGAPVSRDEPSASDALFVLRTAVGVGTCARCECDVGGDGSITASDALLTLKKAVGQAVDLVCS